MCALTVTVTVSHSPGVTRRMLSVSGTSQALMDSGTGKRMAGLGKRGSESLCRRTLTFRSRAKS